MLLSKTSAARVLSLFFMFPIKRRYILSPSSSFSSLNTLASSPQPQIDESLNFDSKLVALTFQNWFTTRDYTLLDRIFEILAAKDEGFASELELNRLGLRLNEHFVLRVLNHGQDVLSCLKFFDWAGRQNGYYHTRATFNAIFKILSRAQLKSLMLDFLETYKMLRWSHRVRFNDTLVVGYAVAGKPDIALKLFSQMRFRGLDLDQSSYHVFLNALVEHNCYDVVEVVLKQITMNNYYNEITSCIKAKNFCKQDKLNDAVSLLYRLECRGHVVNDKMISVVVDAHCKKNSFEVAQKLMEDFWRIEKIPLKYTYSVWTRDLVQAGKIDGALEFLRRKKLLEGYTPDVFRYNILICKLLRENRLDDVNDLLMEMMDGEISPDKLTMNAALCFFCKAGMVDVALELYKSRSKFGLNPNSLSYNYLINVLCGDGSVDEAYRVLRDSFRNGYFPGKRTSSILADALCREGKLDMMKELVIMALELNAGLSDVLCAKFISALCKARRVEDGYLIFGELNGMHKVRNRYAYFDLIHSFNRANRGDMAARLMIEMQDNGHRPDRKLYRAVISCICTMDNPENQFFNLLEMQLSRQQPDSYLYNCFIDGAGHARRPDLAKEVFEMMGRNGIQPTNDSKLFMLQSCLKSERIADALSFYGDLCKSDKPPGRRLNNTMVVGLSKANKPGLALEILKELREKKLFPSVECYEELVRAFCSNKNYDMAIEVIHDLLKTNRKVSSFIGNTFLLHSFRSAELYQAWFRSGIVTREASLDILNLRELIGLFSGGFRKYPYTEDLDEVIEQFECFPLDVFTYNVLLRRLSMSPTLDSFIHLVSKMQKRGYRHNKWTYDTIVHSLCKHGKRKEALKWMEEAHRMGFDLMERTKELL